MHHASHPVEVLRFGLGSGSPAHDVAATEEPLEIRLGDRSFVVIMRTPGADHELAAGFLLAERIVQRPDEIGSIRHCTQVPPSPLASAPQAVNVPNVPNDPNDPNDPNVPNVPNVLSVWLTGAAAERAAERLTRKRAVVSSSSCGVCGRQSIDDLMQGASPVAADWTITSEAIVSMPDRLCAAQKVFEQTGGLHAAGLFDPAGALLRIAEDVGRHNAVDKVIGAELLAGRVPLSGRVLFVSGRTSFEILQKAIVAGIPIVASVSAPSSLAIDLARTGNVTLVGFVRGGTFNVYNGAGRIETRPHYGSVP